MALEGRVNSTPYEIASKSEKRKVKRCYTDKQLFNARMKGKKPLK